MRAFSHNFSFFGSDILYRSSICNLFSILAESTLTKCTAQLVACWPEEASALTESPWIKHITFIGSEEVGRKVKMGCFLASISQGNDACSVPRSHKQPLSISPR